NIDASLSLYGDFSLDDRTVSFLPWAHIFGQMCDLHMVICYGGSTALNDELPKLFQNIAEVKPTVLIAVPRIFNRIYDAVKAEIGDRPEVLQKILHSGTHGTVGPAGEAPPSPIVQKIRERFGGRLKYAVSGSAALSKEVALFVDSLG